MENTKKLIYSIAELAAHRNDPELLVLFRRKIKLIQEESEEIAIGISRRISAVGGLGAMRRFKSLDEVPVDSDSGMELLHVEEIPYVEVAPIIDSQTKEHINRFMTERHHGSELLKKGLRPPTSLALMGPPGVGKTSMARWIAKSLNLPIMILNLASIVTSYLGQTGQNIKKALDRAKLEPSVLLLDEFDALGRFRIGDNDVGEMKRVVTVLLQEIEQWPEHGLVIAATNLPELIDPAFRRRFSRWIWLSLPGCEERIQIIRQHYKGGRIPERYLDLASICLPQASGADVAAFANRVATSEVIEQISPIQALIQELSLEIQERQLDKETKGKFAKMARGVDPKRFTYRKLGELLNVSHSTAKNMAI